MTPCCRGQCLKAIGEEDAMEILIGCLQEISGLQRQEKHNLIFEKVLNATSCVSEGGYLDCTYNLGTGVHAKAYGVCHTCFEHAYELGPSQLYKIRGEVKRGMCAD